MLQCLKTLAASTKLLLNQDNSLNQRSALGQHGFTLSLKNRTRTSIFAVVLQTVVVGPHTWATYVTLNQAIYPTTLLRDLYEKTSRTFMSRLILPCSSLFLTHDVDSAIHSDVKGCRGGQVSRYPTLPLPA